ncbi:hypothetical protein EIP86_005862 [Pleurotus ostreatoroseus]|nr:hypothetical protein EIP86_005862 [Pleurotus ostreatoroseus]
MAARFRTTRPDMHTSRLAWEQSWEEDLNFSYHPSVLEHRSLIDMDLYKGLEDIIASDATAHVLHEYVRHICNRQWELAKETAQRFAEDDFERVWLSQSHEERCEVVMEGIYRTMCLPTMERGRRFCPDSTLSCLASNQGRTYIDMLKAALPRNIDAASCEPLYFPHPIVDHVLSLTAEDEKKPEAVALRRLLRFCRTYCLTNLLLIILRTFVSLLSGITVGVLNAVIRQYGAQAAVTYRVTKSPRMKADDVQKFPLAVQHTLKQEELVRKKYGVYSCQSCGKDETALEGKKLLACGRCRNLERKVWYCSR